jgi:hypothetical protein
LVHVFICAVECRPGKPLYGRNNRNHQSLRKLIFHEISRQHNPRGSINRLNEAGDRTNENRLFDSQANARGGYGVNAFAEPMSFLVGSELTVDFSTHLCNDGNGACSVILQYYCTPNDTAADTRIRDGLSLQTISDSNFAELDETGALKYGMHESLDYGRRCSARKRNTLLYSANRPFAGDSARFTRQNSGGTRSGFECAEERDYYPYWHPAPWKDIAVLLQNHSAAECARFQAQSQNVVPTGHCEPKSDTATMTDKEAAWRLNNKAECETGGNNWRVTPGYGLAPPFCGVMPSGSAFSHTIKLPDEPSCVGKAGTACVCVMRLRLNVTVPGADSGLLKQDMTVTVAGKPLSLALNTNHLGRTFEDRSHAFVLRARPAEVPSTQRVVNLNVRGKRGNFVQTFPAVQYEFVPRHAVLEGGRRGALSVDRIRQQSQQWRQQRRRHVGHRSFQHLSNRVAGIGDVSVRRLLRWPRAAVCQDRRSRALRARRSKGFGLRYARNVEAGTQQQHRRGERGPAQLHEAECGAHAL